MSEVFPNVSYVIIGSKERLSRVKSYQIEEGVECLLCPFQLIEDLPTLLDSIIAELNSSAISIIPAGAYPKKDARAQLFHFGNKFKGAAQSIGKLNTLLNKVPQLEQGIFFSKSLYFSVGGLGDSGVNPFAELAKRFYLRLDPQNPLPSLTIRAKSLLN